MTGRPGENSQPLGKIDLHPVAQLRRRGQVFSDSQGQDRFSYRPVRRVEDSPDISGHFPLERLARDIGLSVLLGVELAVLSGNISASNIDSRIPMMWGMPA